MPRKKYNLFLFDLDGTLLDTAPEFHQSLNKLLKSHGLKNKNFTQIRSKVSDGVNALIEMAFNISEAEDGFLNLRESMLETYKKVSLNSKLFPNVAKVLDALAKQNISWGIVTNKPKEFTLPIFENFGWENKTEILVCPDDVNNLRKPDPASLDFAINLSKFSKEKCIYVGDNWRDIEAANNSGIDSILVSYGYVTSEELMKIKPTYKIDDSIELLNFM